ncbi:MAG: helix-turn-helix domain-containing protein [Candidatus Parabeggiatoa sp.]|nr:helix-turn-helix domain-containing protein [Candidatus Parabeggiatoa sp.]
MFSQNKTPKKHRILASLGNVITFFAASVGVPIERITKATGLSPTALMDPDTRIPDEFILKVFRLLAKAQPGKNLSLQLTRIVPFTFLGSPWRLLSMAPDMHTMQELLVQNSDLLADKLEIESNDTPTERILRLYHPFDEIDEGMGGEVCIGLGARITRECFGDEVLARVQFRHAARNPVSVYEDFFKVPVTFQADFNALVSHHKEPDWPNKKARIETRESLEWQLACLRQELGMENTDELADIREAIVHNATKGDYTVFRLAQRMGMSLRSLQRRISASGSSARALLDEARYAKALSLLANERISIEKVASQLGFSDERSFRKAFQRWSQKTPALIRREMKQED